MTRMADPRHALGAAAEEAVARWLSATGWEVVARRHRSMGGGEVDIVAIDPGGMLVAVEVRARRSARSGSAAASVDGRRIARLRRSLVAIGATAGRRHRGCRVDVVTVEPVPDSPGHWRLARIPAAG